MRLMDSESAVGMPVNLGNPNELTVGELVGLVLKMTRSRSRVVRRPLPEDDPRRRKPDIARARQLLGWEPRVDLKIGLEATIDWFAAEQARERKPWRGVAAPDRAEPIIQAAE
jgi:UDP-glucuronate decarboxylase